MDIRENIKEFEKLLGGTGVKLVAVSKTKPVGDIMEAYEAGHRDFGKTRYRNCGISIRHCPKISDGT